jgi:hypothetical protein
MPTPAPDLVARQRSSKPARFEHERPQGPRGGLADRLAYPLGSALGLASVIWACLHFLLGPLL